MPTYQYVCTECGDPLEAVQSFSDAALTECPACAGRLRKVFSSVGVVFKGSGFYRNDSRDSGVKVDAKKGSDGTSSNGSSDGASTSTTSSDSTSSPKDSGTSTSTSTTTSSDSSGSSGSPSGAKVGAATP